MPRKTERSHQLGLEKEVGTAWVRGAAEEGAWLGRVDLGLDL